MKLSPDEQQTLRWLGAATLKPTDETSRLVKLGLATQGKSHFGEYVKITEAGRKLLPQNATVSDDGAGALEASAGPKRSVAPRGRRNATARDRVPTTAPTSLQPPVTPPKAGAVSNRASAPKAQPQPRQPAPAGAKASGTINAARADLQARNAPIPQPAARAAPNAVRVVTGNRATYYPLTSYESIRHGEKARVRTNHRVFSSCPVAASAEDEIVP